MGFSNQNREITTHKIKSKTFDLLIIGGGFTGANIVLDATTRGMKTVLLEMSDFSAQASSRQSMLITEQEDYDYRTWKLLENEKKVIQANYSPLYHPVDGIHLKYKGDLDLKNLTTISRGVFFPFKRKYTDQSLKILRRKQIINLESNIVPDQLERGFLFNNGLINRTLMTIELLKKSRDLGANVLNYFKVTDFIYDNKQKIIGVKAEDQINGESVSFFAHRVINATGNALNQIRQIDTPELKGEYPSPVNKVTQFQLKTDKLLTKHVISFHDIARHGFMTLIPNQDRLIVTATEPVNKLTNFNEDWSAEDSEHYLKVCKSVIQTEELTDSHISDVHVNFEIKYQQKTDPNNLVLKSDSGLISVLGTAAISGRLHASKMVDLIAIDLKKELNILYSGSETQLISINQYNQIEKETLIEPYDQLSISDDQLDQLIEYYGDEVSHLLDYVHQSAKFADQFDIDRLLCAELLYAVEQLAIYTPLDFFARRSRIRYDKLTILEQLPGLLNLLASQLAWTIEERSYFERELKIWLKDQS